MFSTAYHLANITIPVNVTSCCTGYTGTPATNCTDINECDSFNGGCEYTCENTPGSYICSCPLGYNLRPNGGCEG